MEHFEIGACFKSYNELMDKLKEYCNSTNTKFTTKDSRLITDEFATAKESFVYSELKLICVFGRQTKFKTGDRKRKMRNLKIKKTECPAYFRIRLIHSGVALQVVALNINHNHPLEKFEEKPQIEEIPKTKRKKLSNEKQVSSLKLEIKSEDDSLSSDDVQASELIEVFIEPDEAINPETRVEFSFRGFCAPVFTVFEEKSPNDLIDKYAEYLLFNGIQGVLVNDAMGEGMSMSVSERKLVTERWAKAVKATDQHLMVQIGGCPLPDVLELTEHAENNGVDSLLCLPEMFFKPSNSKQLIDYLTIVCEAAPKTPVLYHHIPAYTGVNINMAQVLDEVSEKIPNFCGLVYTSNDLEGGVAALEAREKKYVVFFGEEKLLTGAFLMGFDSAILPSLNMFPQYIMDISHAIKKSKISEARKIQEELLTRCSVINKFGSLVPAMKVAMNILSPVNVGLARSPLKNLTDDEMSELEQKLEDCKSK
ncbi:unnamed protein product [Phaedon cochleariae]|uniref:N-acetylneuraminate lyase n=1 Tax=Phaedon cochleariae TaxID=80249 RepID=A0A9P0GQW1_PHACE|nr:unnamed protein product [Phaedon cochleariae]